MKASPLQLNHSHVGRIALQPNTGEFSDDINITTTPTFGRSAVVANQWQLKLQVIFKS
jgi:hypothetical protein